MTYQAMTRKEARALKLTSFERDKPCAKNHGAPFNTKNGRCVQCAREEQKAWQDKKKDQKIIAGVAI